jgi:ribosomal protein S12 methylthiotransferase accessory factor
LYGAGVFEQAHALIMQTDRFMGISAPSLMMEGCEMQHKLWSAYAKVQILK